MGIRRTSRWSWKEPTDAEVEQAVGVIWALGFLAALGACLNGHWLQAFVFATVGFLAGLAALALLQ